MSGCAGRSIQEIKPSDSARVFRTTCLINRNQIHSCGMAARAKDNRVPLVRADEGKDFRRWGEDSSGDEEQDRMPGYTPLPTEPLDVPRSGQGTGRMRPVSLRAEFDALEVREEGDEGEDAGIEPALGGIRSLAPGVSGDGHQPPTASFETRSTRLHSEVQRAPARADTPAWTDGQQEGSASSQAKSSAVPSSERPSLPKTEEESPRKGVKEDKSQRELPAAPEPVRRYPHMGEIGYDRYSREQEAARPRPKYRPGEEIIFVSHGSRHSQPMGSSTVWQAKWDVLTGARADVVAISKWDYVRLPGLRKRLENPKIPKELFRAGAKVEVRCGEVFTGDPSTGCNLQDYWMDIASNMSTWEDEGWSLRTMFHRMHATLRGDAARFYQEVLDGVLDMPQTDRQGEEVLDADGQVVPIQDPVSLFMALLERAYPTNTRARATEYENFMRGPTETALACEQRLRGLAADLGYVDSAELARKYLNAQPREIRNEAKREAARSGIYLRLRTARDAVTFVEVDMRMAGWEPEGDEEEQQMRGARKRLVGVAHIIESNEGPGLRVAPRTCWNCGQEGHLARFCPKESTRPPGHVIGEGQEGPGLRKERDEWQGQKGEREERTIGRSDRDNWRRGNEGRAAEREKGRTIDGRSRELAGRGDGKRGGRTAGTGTQANDREGALEREIQRLRTQLVDERRGRERSTVHLAEGSGERSGARVHFGFTPHDQHEESEEEDEQGAVVCHGQAEEEWEELWNNRPTACMVDVGTEMEAYLGERRDKGDLGLRGWKDEEEVVPRAVGPGRPIRRKHYATCSIEVDPDPPARGVEERQEQEATVVRLNNQEGVVRLEGLAPRRIIVDTGANRMVMGRKLADALGDKARPMDDMGTVMGLASGSARVQLTEESLELCLMEGSEHETRMRFRFLVTETEGYDLLLGTPLWYKVGGDISFWKEKVWYRSDYLRKTGYRHIVSLPATFTTRRLTLERVQEGEFEDEIYCQGNRAVELLGEQGLLQELAVWNPAKEGAVLLDLFSGIGTAMAAVVRAGIRLKRWYVVESDPDAGQAAEQLRRCIEREEGIRLPQRQAGGIPQDIRQISDGVLQGMGRVDVIVAGWECQGHSRAGAGGGLGDDRSGLFWELVRVLRAAKREWPGVAIILENVNAREDYREGVRNDFRIIEGILGEGIELDAARFGSRAHRSRLYWTNLVELETLQEEAHRVQRDAGLVVRDILEPGRSVRLVERDDGWGQYACNFAGAERRAWPTLMATTGSYAFRMRGGQPGPGMVWDDREKGWTEPTAKERERAMGFPESSTAAHGLSEQSRRRLLGNAMDLNTLAWLILVGVEYAEHRGVEERPQGMLLVSQEEAREEIEFQWSIGEAWPARARDQLIQELELRRSCFAFKITGLGKYSGPIRFKIKLDTAEPIRQPKRRWSPDHEAVAKEKCQELLEAGLIVRSESPHAAATVMAKKIDLLGEKGALRMCGDYRWLNRHTERDSYPMPCPEEIFDRLGPCHWFSTLDLRQGFNQIPLTSEDQPKTAFHGPDGLYHWTVMPFGLRNASACFQRVMNCTLEGLDYTACFIDDVIVYSMTAEEHLQHVCAVLERIQSVGLTCHPRKCAFAQQSIPYLGLQVGKGQLTVQEAKVAVLDQLPAPTDLGRLRTFLGFTGYYRKFVKDYAMISKPLTILTRKDESWRWEEVHEQAFRKLCQVLQTAPVLSLPHFDKPFVLYTDWSSVGMGSILSQEPMGEERVIAYASRSCNSAESNYSSYEGEGAAVVWGVMHFRAYLQGRRFTLVTDHQPLEWLMSTQTLRGRNARWAMILQEFDFVIRHRAGKQQQHVDGLSRNPSTYSETMTQWEPAELDWQPARALALMGDEADRAALHRYRAEKGSRGTGDVWRDEETMLWLQGGDNEEAERSKENVTARGRGRALSYRWDGEKLWIRRQEGERQVPPPAQRSALYWQVHNKLGHYGGARTLQLLRTTYWWNNMQGDMRKWQAQCEICAKVRAQTVRTETALQSLPIRELGHRWSLDLLGELPLSRRGKRYVLVMIEHVSKWVELVALSSKSANGIASAFLRDVLSRFGACAEVLTDQGGEFKGALQRLLASCGIQHRSTSAYHPEANGLTERAVQTFKRGLRKYALVHDTRDWDLELPWLLMGYRFSKQASTKLSPYYMLYGRDPVLPVGSPRELSAALPESTATDWVKAAKLKAQLFRTIMPTALGNLQAAQERDSRRHQMRRNKIVQDQTSGRGALQTGEWVYIRRPAQNTLDVSVSDERWQVQEMRQSGVVRLRSRTGEERLVHQSQCMGATQQVPGRNMGADREHEGMSSPAGGNDHVSGHREKDSNLEPTWRQLQDRKVTAVYQRRKKAVGQTKEHATAVTIESFYDMIH